MTESVNAPAKDGAARDAALAPTRAKTAWTGDPRSAEALRQRTNAVHTTAERSGVVADIVRKRVTRAAYALFLRNLLPAYRQLEGGLERRRAATGVAEIFRPKLARVAALEHDLAALCGRDWRERLPVLPAAQAYADRIAAAARNDGALLIAHAYVRYFGDLSGGQILQRVLGEAPGIERDALRFYDFAGIPDADAFKADYRKAFDAAMRAIADPEAVLAEAVVAFELNVAVSVAAQAHAARPPAAE